MKKKECIVCLEKGLFKENNEWYCIEHYKYYMANVPMKNGKTMIEWMRRVFV